MKIYVVIFLCGVLLHQAWANKDLWEGDKCTLHNGQSGICLKDVACIDRITKLKMKREEIVFCRSHQFGTNVCCPPDDDTTTPRVDPTTSTTERSTTTTTKSTTTTTSTTETPRKKRKAEIVCDRFEREKITPSFEQIIGGRKAKLGEFPHQVGIIQIPKGSVDCGGTLIDKSFVLTAAHCLNKNSKYKVRMGIVAFNDTEQILNMDERLVKNIIIHDNYTRLTAYDDIAILELVEEIVFSAATAPACLYIPTEDPPVTTALHCSGWGRIDRDTSEVPPELMTINLEPAPLLACNASYIANFKDPKLNKGLLSSQLCAVDPTFKKDACTGDSGGPLVIITDPIKRLFRLVGVVSTGAGCGAPIPSLYTRVSSFLDWIEAIVWPGDVE